MTNAELTAYVASHFDGRLVPLDTGRGAPLFEVKLSDLLAVARALRDDPELSLNYLCNLGAIDTGQKLEVVYNIASTTKNLRLDFKVTLSFDTPVVESLKSVWPCADWYEREMWELFGVDVLNHGDLRPLLLPEDWNQGHPMRKNWDAPDFVRMPEL